MAKKSLIAATIIAASMGQSAFAETQVDQLTNEPTATIAAAYDRVLGDPEKNVDWLSPTRMKVVLAAYATHDPEPETEILPQARWVTMQAAYNTHDPERTVLTDATQY